MLRRLASAPVAAAARLAGAARFYTASPELVKLYNSNFDAEAYPVDIVPGDSTLFAKFLYKAAEPKKELDGILKDFDTINTVAKKLGVFWERHADLEAVAEFKALNPATQFTLRWMQTNGVLEQLPAVRSTYETYVNAQKKRVVAKVSLKGSATDNAAEAAAAKVAAAELQKTIASATGCTLDFQFTVDPTIVSGYTLELSGKFVNAAKGAESNAAVQDIDYTAIPVGKLLKTLWPENVETDVLRRYCEQHSQFDAEEAKNGV